MEKNLEKVAHLIHRKFVRSDTIIFVECNYKVGYIRVFYNDRTDKTFPMPIDVYNHQFGNVPISAERNRIFWGSWEKGICAYDLITGEVIWKIKGWKFRNILVFDKYLITVQQYNKLLRLDIETGEILNEVKSGTLKSVYKLDDRHFYTNAVKGIGTVYDAMDMSVYKSYPKASLPRNFSIRDVFLEGKCTQAMYDAKKAEIKEQIKELEDRLELSPEAGKEAVSAMNAILQVVSVAREIMNSSVNSKKREFLRLILSNCVLTDKSACFYLKKPFEKLLFTKGCKMGLGQRDSNQRHTD